MEHLRIYQQHLIARNVSWSMFNQEEISMPRELRIQPPQTWKTSCGPDVMHYTDAAEDKTATIETP